MASYRSGHMKPTNPRGGKIDFTIPEMFPLIESGTKHITIRKHHLESILR